MSFLETILNIFKSNKKNAKIIVQDLNKNYGDSTPLEIGLYEDTIPLVNQEISIIINNVEYKRTTNNTGIATININLNAGKYTALIKYTNPDYNTVTAYANINITEPKTDTRMEGTDINKPYGDNTPYQCAIYNNKNERIYDTVYITVNGKTYAKTPDTNGLYKLNINLNVGEYIIKAVFTGNDKYNASEVTNTIKITKPVNTTNVKETNTTTTKKCNNPYQSKPYKTSTGCDNMGQNNSYCCSASTVQKCLYKLGIEVSQSKLSTWGGVTTNGVGHDGINTMIAKVNQVYGTNLSIKWYNFSDLGWKGIGELLCQDNIAIGSHVNYRLKWGHYEHIIYIDTNTKIVKVINSLGNKCNQGCYCGYIESRSFNTEKSYFDGISQKSIFVITKN